MSRIILNGNGKLDISPHSAAGMSIGSLEGNGLLYLGGWPLSVGSNSLKRTFAGIIQDGGLKWWQRRLAEQNWQRHMDANRGQHLHRRDNGERRNLDGMPTRRVRPRAAARCK